MTNLFLIGACFALPYLLYGIIQTLRGRAQVDRLGVLLAFLAVMVPMAALTLNAISATTQPVLTLVMLVNALLVLVVSAVILILDYRKQDRDLSRSFGALGVGISTLLLVGLFSTPLILNQFPAQTSAAQVLNTAGSSADGAIVPASFTSQVANPGAASVSQAQVSSGGSALTAALERETGLSVEDILTQLNAGTSLHQLVSDYGGDLEAVSQALTAALDTAIAAGTLPAQMVERMGGDAAAIATSALNGQVPPMILSGLLGGEMPAGGPPAGAAGAPPQGSAGAGAAAGSAVVTPEIPAAAGPLGVNAAAAQTEEPASESSSSTAETARIEPTKLPTPTPFLFDMEPTATPAAVAATAEEGEAAAAVEATCPLVVNFNLNMRTDPNPVGTWIRTIPAYTSVTSSGHNAENWWQVTVEDQTGWVSGEYLTADRSCSTLPVLD
ncbi:MAG: SH3 domain-containing protein [Anaerolineae bacterium]|nr:SH3 domain-containing protein [Anaerolineae bacterium]